MASVLHTFNIGPPLDDKGEIAAITPIFSDGLISYVGGGNLAEDPALANAGMRRLYRAPEPFQCSITPRSSMAEALIRLTSA